MAKKAVVLADLLKSRCIGVDPKRVIEELPTHPSIAARLLKNQHLDIEPLTLTGSEGEVVNLKDTENTWAHSLRGNDVLVTTKFIYHPFAAVVPSTVTPLPLYAYTNIAVLQPDNHRIDSQYLALWFRSEAAAEALKVQAKVYSRGMHSVSLTTLLKTEVFVPSIDHQLELVEFDRETRLLRQHIRDRQIKLQQNLASK